MNNDDPGTRSESFPLPALRVLSAILLGAGGCLVAAPVLRFEETVHDCGKLTSGQSARFAFKFTNPGDQPLEIASVQPGCGCTTTGDWTRRVEPGQEGTIPITFSQTGEGAFVKAVTVTSNDASQPVSSLQIKGTLWTPFEITPPSVVFNQVEGETGAAAQTVRLSNRTGQDAVISEAVCTHDGFRTTIKTVTPGKEFDLVIEPVPGKPLVPGVSTVTAKTNLKEAPTLTFSVISAVLPAIMVSPGVIYLPAGPLKTALPFHLLVRNNAKEPVKLSDIEISDPDISLKTTASEPGRVFAIDGAFPAGYEMASAKDLKLSFKTDHPKSPRMEVPVTTPPVPIVRQPPATRMLPALVTPAPVVLVPRLQFITSSHDFAEVDDREPLSHEFKFINEEKKAVEITAVQACSNKGSADTWTHRVEPGESGGITVRLDPAGLSGRVDIAFLVMGNQQTTPVAELHLKATIGKAPEKETPKSPTTQPPPESASSKSVRR